MNSPTGTPLIPPKLVPLLMAAYLLAEGLSGILPAHTIGAQVAKVVAGVLVALGLASPGLRKAEAAGQEAVASNPGKGIAAVVEIKKGE